MQPRLVTIKFHKLLQKFTGVAEHTIEASSYYDVIQACYNLFPELYTATKKALVSSHEELWLLVNRKPVMHDDLLLPPSQRDELLLLPMLYGGGGFGKILGIIAGVALIAAAIFLPGIGIIAAGLTLTSGILLGVGITLILGAIFSPPKPKSSSSPGSATSNSLFGPLNYTTSTQTPVFLNYGRIRLAGQIISGYVDTINHGKSDNIRLDDYIGIDASVPKENKGSNKGQAH